MFYLYLDHELIACSDTFNEIYDIILNEICVEMLDIDLNGFLVWALASVIKYGRGSWRCSVNDNLVRFDLFYSK